MSSSRPPLGQVLIEAGLLTEAQLGAALEVQQRTRRPLGEVLIQQGYVSPAAIANALADQHGGLLRTEYGIATGLRRRTSAANTSVPLAPPALPGPPPPPDATIAGHVAELAKRFAPKESAPAVDAEEEPFPALRIAAAAPPQAAPEEEQMPPLAIVEPAAPTEPDAVAERDALAEAVRNLDAMLSQVEERARELDDLAIQLEQALASVPPQQPAPVAPLTPVPAADERHVLLVPTASGVERVARTGAAPAVGQQLDLLISGELVRFAVHAIEPGTLAGSYVPCARLGRVANQ